MNNENQKNNSDVSDLYAVVNKRKSQQSHSKEETEDVSALYAVVDKNKNTLSAKGENQNENRNDCGLYATIDKSKKNNNMQQLQAFQQNSAKTVESGNTTTEEYSMLVHSNVPKDGLSNNNISPYFKNLTKHDKQRNVHLPALYNILLIATAIMAILIIILVINTAIGFAKVSTLEFELSSLNVDISKMINL